MNFLFGLLIFTIISIIVVKVLWVGHSLEAECLRSKLCNVYEIDGKKVACIVRNGVVTDECYLKFGQFTQHYDYWFKNKNEMFEK